MRSTQTEHSGTIFTARMIQAGIPPHAQNDTLVTCNLFAPDGATADNNDYLRMVQHTIRSLGDQTDQSFDIGFIITPNIKDIIVQIFKEQAPHIALSRLHFFEIDIPDGQRSPTNFQAITQRFEYLRILKKIYPRAVLLDGDDELDQEFMLELQSKMDETNADTVAADMVGFKSTKQDEARAWDDPDNQFPIGSRRMEDGHVLTFEEALEQNDFGGFCNVLVKTEALDDMTDDFVHLKNPTWDINGKSRRPFDAYPDYLLWMRMTAAGKKLVFAKDAKLYYRQHENNISGIFVDSPESLGFDMRSRLHVLEILSENAILPQKQRDLVDGTIDKLWSVMKKLGDNASPHSIQDHWLNTVTESYSGIPSVVMRQIAGQHLDAGITNYLAPQGHLKRTNRSRQHMSAHP